MRLLLVTLVICGLALAIADDVKASAEKADYGVEESYDYGPHAGKRGPRGPRGFPACKAGSIRQVAGTTNSVIFTGINQGGALRRTEAVFATCTTGQLVDGYCEARCEKANGKIMGILSESGVEWTNPNGFRTRCRAQFWKAEELDRGDVPVDCTVSSFAVCCDE